MGFFDSETVITVGSAVTPLVTDKPNLARTAIVKAIFNDTDITGTLLSTIIAGYNVDPLRLYNYAKDGGYFLGLPKSSLPEPVPKYENLPTTLGALHNTDPSNITVESALYTSQANEGLDYWANYYLQYHTTRDGQGRVTSGFTFLPTGYVAEIDHYEYSYEKDEQDPDDPYDGYERETQILVKYEYTMYDPNNQAATSSSGELEYEFKDMDLADREGIDDSLGTVYLVKYQVNNGIDRWFIYEPETELYPELDVYSLFERAGEFFPFIPLRVDKEFVGEGTGFFHEHNDDIEEILDLIGVDLYEMQDAIADNPDVDDIDDSLIMVAVPLSASSDLNASNKQGTLQYLKDFFIDIQLDNDTTKAEFEATKDTDVVAFNSYLIQDSQFNVLLFWNYIEEYAGTYDPNKNTYHMEVELIDNGKNPTTSSRTYYSSDKLIIEYHNHRTQTCWVTEINGVYHVNIIRNWSDGDGTVITTLAAAFDPVEADRSSGFYIPISYNHVREYPLRTQTEIVLDGLCLINLALVVTKVDWYKTDSFRIFVQIVIVAVAIISQNYQLIAAGELTVAQVALIILETVASNYLIGLLLKPLLKILIDVFGIEVIAVVAAVLVVAGFLDATDIIDLTKTLPNAELLLQLSTQIQKGVTDYIQEASTDLRNEYASFLEEASQVQQEIDDALATITESVFDPSWTVLKNYKVEAPTTFYTRTLTPDIGLKTLDTIDYFYDNALSINTDNY